MGDNVVSIGRFYADAVKKLAKNVVSFSRHEVGTLISIHAKSCEAEKAVDCAIVTGTEPTAFFAMYQSTQSGEKVEMLRVSKAYNTQYKGLSYTVSDGVQTIHSSDSMVKVECFLNKHLFPCALQLVPDTFDNG